MKKYLRIIGLVFMLSITYTTAVDAQCPMCRMSAETNLENGGTAGKGLNKGILYMLTAPYLLVGLIGYTFYKNKKKENNPEGAKTFDLPLK